MTFKTSLVFSLILAVSVNLPGCASAPKNNSPLRPWQKTALKGYSQKSVDTFGITFVIRAWASNQATLHVNTARDLAVAEINRISKMADGEISVGEVNAINEKAYKEAVIS